MNKKLKIAVLIAVSLFTVACTNTEKAKNTSTKGNMQSSKGEQNEKPSVASITESITSSKENENKAALESSNNAAGIYNITKKVYKNKNITVNYPQITNLGDANKQRTINQLIKNDVLSYINSNIAGESSLELEFNIKLQTPDLISIQYSGVASSPNAVHPSNIFYTTNISVSNGKKLRLSDLVNVDIKLANAFKKGQYVDSGSKYTKEEQAQIIKYFNDNISTNDLIKYFNGADSPDVENVNPSSTFSYLTKDSIVISIDVPHALGDHAEFSIPLSNIQKKLK